jgi:hypothetical protein
MKTGFLFLTLLVGFASNSHAEELVKAISEVFPVKAPDSTNASDDASSPLIHFHSLPLQSALSLYARFKDRTLLIHPQLGNPTFSLDQNISNRAEAADLMEKMFNGHEIAVIPDGEHFVMVVPYSQTNAVTPKADSLPKSNSLIPPQSINFRNVPVRSMVEIDADFLHKKIVNFPAAMNQLAGSHVVTFVQENSLSREEICYAMQTLLAWHNIQLVPDGDDLKLEPIH